MNRCPHDEVDDEGTCLECGTFHARDQTGPPGSYGCACVSRDPRECHRLRHPFRGYLEHGIDERCECMCHQWDDDE